MCIRDSLDRIELDVLANFKRMGVATSLLDGKERLHLLHRIFHTDTPVSYTHLISV